MSYVLLLVILLMAGGGYFEYESLQQSLAADDQRVIDLQAKSSVGSEKDQKALEDKDNQLATAHDTIKSLTAQLQEATTQLTLAKAAAAAPAAATAAKAASPAPMVGVSTTKLGTIATLDGKRFQECKLLKVDADGIVVNHTAGITKILFNAMSPDLQKVFGYDPHVESGLSPDQLTVDETRRQVANAAGN